MSNLNQPIRSVEDGTRYAPKSKPSGTSENSKSDLLTPSVLPAIQAVLEDSCALVSIANQITLDDFYFLNPGVDDTCSNLWVDASYCVKPVGNIETYPGYPVIMPETSFTRPPISTVQPTEVPLPTLLPFAPGTDEDCHLYTYVFEDEDWDLDKCEIVARGSRITVDDFMKWNPSLSEDSCLLQPGLQYCVAKTEIGMYELQETKDKHISLLHFVEGIEFPVIYPSGLAEIHDA